MAKRKRAPVRARRSTRAPASPATPPAAKPPSRNRYVFTPELLAHARRLYEETDTSLAKIGIDLGIHRSTVERIGEREGWVRHARAPHGLPPAARLLAEAERLEQAALTDDRHPEAPGEAGPRSMIGPDAACASRQQPTCGGRRPSRLAALAPQGDGESEVCPAQDDAESMERGEQAPPVAETIERLYRAVLDELAAVEAMRAQLGRHPRGAVEAERTARTLSRLTETFQKLQRLQIANAPSGTLDDDDDMPADIDAFRLELARRIEAFVASRTEPDDAEGASVAAPLDEV
jgi:hypothetical protein